MKNLSSQIVASIDDLLIEILIRLPVKSLLRFKLVSKRWLSLISDPTFTHRHNATHKTAVGLFFKKSDDSYDYFSYNSNEPKNGAPSLNFNFAVDPSRTKVVDSCNGLFLCRSKISEPFKRIFYVYNPTTNKSFKILESEKRLRTDLTLAFDPAKSQHFNVVSSHVTPDYTTKILVYSSDSSAWTVATEVKEGDYSGTGIYLNGSIHWISRVSLFLQILGFDQKTRFFRFDIDRQVCAEMPRPHILIGDSKRIRNERYFGQSCDHLHYIEAFGHINFNVYEMKRDYSEWFVKYRVDLSLVVTACNVPWIDTPNGYCYTIFDLVCGLEKENQFLVLNLVGEAIKYNLVDKTFEHIHKIENRRVNIKGFQYIESLWPVR